MAQYYDTLLGEYIKNPGNRGLSLDKLSKQIFEYEMISYDEITNKKKLNFIDVPLEEAAKYSAEDVVMTSKLFTTQKKELSNNKILKEIEFPLIEVLKEMEISGVKIDRNKLKEIGLTLENEIKNLEKDIYNISETEFNINSPKQVGEILFEKMGLPKGKKTKTGWSVGAEVLNDLSKKFSIAEKIVTYRHYTKILSTYINGILELLDENDLVHTSYNATVTSTGRLSSTSPNLQNIPSSNGIAGEVRAAFTSRFEKGKIMVIDYSQVEVRILAIMSQDKELLNSFKQNIDIHQKTADFIETKDRKIAKAVNFGVIYGISAFGLSKMIDIGVKESKIYIDKFFENYPNVRAYLDNTIKKCELTGNTETLFGRKRYIAGINDKNRIIKSAAEREAINMPVQGTSADIIKIAMIKIKKFIDKNKLKSKMIMQVHDELVFDVYPGEEEILSKNTQKIMENILIKDFDNTENLELIPLIAEYGIGKNWKEAK
ncbi:DNA polymerase I [Candidatus Gracilibacteria bacterium]|nr:MAG: DNA polymerase I [Candidatus Gracilibacteria bacterium]